VSIGERELTRLISPNQCSFFIENQCSFWIEVEA
jgi:hypothetical protein